MRLRKLSKVTACGVVMAALTNCAGWQQRMAQFEYDTSSDACVAVGYTEAHPQHEECIANTTAVRKAQGQREAQETILGGLMLGLAIRGSGTNAAPPPTSRSSSAEDSSHLATSEMVRNKAIDQWQCGSVRTATTYMALNVGWLLTGNTCPDRQRLHRMGSM